MAAGIAHEISTPVQFVGESVELLRQAFGSLRSVNVKFRSVLERIGTEEIRRAIADADGTLCAAGDRTRHRRGAGRHAGGDQPHHHHRCGP